MKIFQKEKTLFNSYPTKCKYLYLKKKKKTKQNYGLKKKASHYDHFYNERKESTYPFYFHFILTKIHYRRFMLLLH